MTGGKRPVRFWALMPHKRTIVHQASSDRFAPQLSSFDATLGVLKTYHSCSIAVSAREGPELGTLLPDGLAPPDRESGH